MQVNLVLNYKKYENQNTGNYGMDYYKDEELPMVTIQLPVYNEKYVIERLVDSVVKIVYPKNRLQIQVIDDSSDETVQIAANKVKEYAEQGFDIDHFRREDRIGFKAGALSECLDSAKGEFIAIFDADFIPEPDFLLKTLPYFKEGKVGMVQTPWGHINRDYSLLTRLQAFCR